VFSPVKKHTFGVLPSKKAHFLVFYPVQKHTFGIFAAFGEVILGRNSHF